VTAHEKRVLRGIVSDLRSVFPGDAGACEKLAASIEKLLPEKRSRVLKSIPGGTTKERRASKDLSRSERREMVFGAVSERAGGNCEAAGSLGIECGGWLEMDHLYQGSGRRIPEESEETCAMLCKNHHAARTANLPSVAAWNEWCAAWAEKYEHTIIVSHIEHAAVADQRQR
jgi:hypothetical protein